MMVLPSDPAEILGGATLNAGQLETEILYYSPSPCHADLDPTLACSVVAWMDGRDQFAGDYYIVLRQLAVSLAFLILT